IDGARGVLFNVIGGNDMTMHEINTAAEAITNAADSDANIIFGASINPDLGDELIITVVATGFDASYFTKRQANESTQLLKTEKNDTKKDDEAIKDLDMNLEQKAPEITTDANDFHNDSPMPNIWAI